MKRSASPALRHCARRRQRFAGNVGRRSRSPRRPAKAAPARWRRCRCRGRECGSGPSRRGDRAHERQHRIDQRFGVGPRLQRLRRQRKRQAVELAKAEDAVHRLAGRAPLERRASSIAATMRPRSAVPARRWRRPRSVPVKCSTISRASSAGSSIPAARQRRSRAGCSSSRQRCRRDQPSVADIGQQLRLVVGDQRLDDLVELAHHHPVELVERQVDAVVGDPPLRKIVGADALRAVARADLQPARFRALARPPWLRSMS